MRPSFDTIARIAGRQHGRISHELPATDLMRFHGIPMTTVPRILLDVAPRLSLVVLTRACHEAWVRHRVGPPDVEACIARNPTKKGAAKLRRALGSDPTLSDLEEGSSRCCAATGCRFRGRTSTTPATRSTATGRGRA